MLLLTVRGGTRESNIRNALYDIHKVLDVR